MAMAEGRLCDLGELKTYTHVPDSKWGRTRPYGINFKENFADKSTHDIKVRLDGQPNDMLSSQGDWDANCAEKEDGEKAVLSYSDGPVKDCGTIGSGA